MYYGQLPYLLTFAASGWLLQFFAILRGAVSEPAEVGPPFNLAALWGRAQLALALVNLHRILRAIANVMPETVAPVNKEILKKDEASGITTSMCVLVGEKAQSINQSS